MSNKSTVPPYTKTDGTKVSGHTKRKPQSGPRRNVDPDAAVAAAAAASGYETDDRSDHPDDDVPTGLVRPVIEVFVDSSGRMPVLPDHLEWDPHNRTVTLDSDEDGSLIVNGTGVAHAVRDGAGAGDVLRIGDGAGHAERYGDGDGDAIRTDGGEGNAWRDGLPTVADLVAYRG